MRVGSSRCAARAGRSNAYAFRGNHPGVGREGACHHRLGSIDAQTDDDIARNVAEDPDAAPVMTDGPAVLNRIEGAMAAAVAALRAEWRTIHGDR